MTNITDRQGQILSRVVKSHISLADPVSSDYLQKRYRLSYSSATIRAEMQKLTDMNYLYQPHTSSGRIPTDKGYRFFVDSLKKTEDVINERISEKFRKMKREVEDYLSFLQESNRLLSLFSSGLVVSCISETGIFIKDGWKRTFDDPEFSDISKVKNFISMIDYFEESIDNFNLIPSGVSIYIGREAPISKSKDFSIVISRCTFFEDKEWIVAILGPKRMAYDKNIFLINSIIKILKENNL